MTIAYGDTPKYPDDFAHQTKLVDDTAMLRAFAVFWEMGCGKTRPTIQTAAKLWRANKLDGVIVVAPNGVHRNWISDELPAHCDAPWIGLDWHSDLAKGKQQREDERLLTLDDVARRDPHGRRLAWLAIGYEALRTDAGISFARRFAARYGRFGLVVDEGARIKNPTAKRTKVVKGIAHARNCVFVRVLNGTPVANAPLDLYAQMQVLDQYFWASKGIATFTAFKARFAIFREIRIGAERDANQGSVRPLSIEPVNATQADIDAYEHDDAVITYDGNTDRPCSEQGDLIEAADAQRPEVDSQSEPTSDAKQSTVRTIRVIAAYRDLDKLKDMIAPMSHRLTKEDAGLNLPPKLYTRIAFELAPAQRKAYDTLRKQYMLELDNGALVTAAIAMVRILRLQQIACGYLPNPDDPEGEPILFPSNAAGDDVRMEHALELFEDMPHKAIVWARFRHDIDKLMHRLGKRAVRYDGAVTRPADRARAIEDFRKGDPQFFVANPAAISMGVTLTEAKSVAYYSNSFSLTDRLQSEDRAHRIGQHHPVNYYDLVALRTVDVRILESLMSKADVSRQITGDTYRQWLEVG